MVSSVNFFTSKPMEYGTKGPTEKPAINQQYGPRISTENKGVDSSAKSPDGLANLFNNMSILDGLKAPQSAQIAQAKPVETPAINPFQAQPVQPVQATGPNALKDPTFQAAIANNRQLNPGEYGTNYADPNNTRTAFNKGIPTGELCGRLDYHG